jgi:hypothetical protein
MTYLGEIFRFVHVVFGAVGLLAFWVPIFTKKGAVNHVRFGKIFVWSAYIVLGAAAIALATRSVSMIQQGVGLAERPELIAFMVFLGYLTFVTFVIVRHGMQVLQSKPDATQIRTPLSVALSYGAIAASIGIILYALMLNPGNKILLLALSPIGIGNGYGQLRYMSRKQTSPRAWLYEHLGAMLGSGIAFHTAFAVFGITRLFDLGFTGWVAIIPWIAPALIGIPAITIWTRHYQRKFGELT